MSKGVRPSAIRQLTADDAAAYRAARLAGLQHHACEFAASFAEEAALGLDQFAARLTNGTVFGGFIDGALVGLAGFRRPSEAKKRHKGELWGVYVAAAARRLGLGRALVLRVIGHARTEVEQLQATVACANQPARALYLGLGFKVYGVEPRALKVGDRYYDQELLILPLDRSIGLD